MAQRIESYKGSYPLAYYEVGTVYSFYGTNNNIGTYATNDQIRRYSGVLRELDQEYSANVIKPVSSGNSKSNGGHLNRYYGVVVNKLNEYTPKIEVMYIVNVNGHREYGVKRYAVSRSVTTDGKDIMPISTALDGKNLTGKDGVQRAGGITLDEGERKGGITLDEVAHRRGKGVGGITLDEAGTSGVRSNRRTSSRNSGTTNVSYSSAKKVGGITLDE